MLGFRCTIRSKVSPDSSVAKAISAIFRRGDPPDGEHGFDATVDFQRLDEPDVIIICVPTPLTTRAIRT